MDNFLQQEYFGNTVQAYLIAAAIILVGTLLLRLFKRFILSSLQKWAATTEGNIDDVIVQSLERFGIPAAYYLIVYAGLTYLNLSGQTDRVIEVAISVVVTYYILRLLATVILLLLQHNIRKQERGEEKIKQLGGLMIIINIIIWVLGVVFLIDNLGYNVTTIIAGLGIGGIAVALAAQNILGDLFNYFVIFFDRPFEVGDFIIVDDKLGTIEYIGIKTTRIRCLSGEQLIIGNANLTTSRIHNYKRMERRRVVFNFNIDYDTSVEKVRSIPGMVRAIVEQQSPIAFDRVHFNAYGDWSLKFECVYYVLSADYNVYADIQQAINIAMLEAFRQHEIHFAYPVEKIFLNNDRLTITPTASQPGKPEK
ncbi:MAG TPA: mechanosensitive ion channel family protein [Ohtaekwangia sp.]|nr:mechanosensitive ion channel family protein [Ohtaekwangia sp.]